MNGAGAEDRLWRLSAEVELNQLPSKFRMPSLMHFIHAGLLKVKDCQNEDRRWCQESVF